MKDNMAEACRQIVVQHVQSLRTEMAKERTERTKVQTEIQKELEAINQRLDDMHPRTSESSSAYTRIDEVVIGEFHLKSKQGAITMVEEIIHGLSGSP